MTQPPPLLPRPPRLFRAADILNGRTNLRGYPFRYIYITGIPSDPIALLATAYAATTRVDLVLSAVEFLEDRGWELVTIDQSGEVAFLRQIRR